MTVRIAVVLALVSTGCASSEPLVREEREPCPEPNPVAAYLTGAELQAEDDEQRANVRAALTDLANEPIGALARRRYRDYQGRPRQWDLPTVLRKHFVPPRLLALPEGRVFYDCADEPPARDAARLWLSR